MTTEQLSNFSVFGGYETSYFLMPLANKYKTAILTAWDKKEITKLKVNTCSLDHKSALPLYQKLGFNPVQFKDTKRLKTFFN